MTKRKSTAADGEKGTGASRENRKEGRTVRERRSKGDRMGRRNEGEKIKRRQDGKTKSRKNKT